jgi:hypothetical protein
MPLAILLQAQLAPLRKGVKSVRSWSSLTDTFAAIVTRLRSAYLVRWFGRQLPIQGLAMVVTIANMDELRRRYTAVGGGQRREAPAAGPNVMEPLLGMAGTFVGAVATPINSVLFGLAAGALVKSAVAQSAVALNWILGGATGTGLLLVGAVIAVPAVLITWAISGQGRDTFDLLGAIAELVKPLQRFWTQISGRRDRVHNPLLRAVLVAGDRVAALLPRVLGALAFIVTKIGPELYPLRMRLLAAIGIAKEIWGVIMFLVRQVLKVSKRLVVGRHSGPAAIKRGLDAMTSARVNIVLGLREATKTFGVELKRIATLFHPDMAAWWAQTGAPLAKEQTTGQPLFKHLTSFGAEIAVLKVWHERTKEPDGWLKRKLSAHAEGFLPDAPRSYKTWRPLYQQETSSGKVLGPLMHKMGHAGAPTANILGLTAEGMQAVRVAQHPASVFAGEWAAVHRARRRPEPLDRARTTAAYLEIAKRLLTPATAASVRKLEGKLSGLHAQLRAERRLHPVKALPAPARLRPRIATLHVRGSGLQPAALRTWTDELRRELNAAPYPVPAGS